MGYLGLKRLLVAAQLQTEYYSYASSIYEDPRRHVQVFDAWQVANDQAGFTATDLSSCDDGGGGGGGVGHGAGDAATAADDRSERVADDVRADELT